MTPFASARRRPSQSLRRTKHQTKLPGALGGTLAASAKGLVVRLRRQGCSYVSSRKPVPRSRVAHRSCGLRYANAYIYSLANSNADGYDQTDAAGFIKLFGLPLRAAAERDSDEKNNVVAKLLRKVARTHAD